MGKNLTMTSTAGFFRPGSCQLPLGKQQSSALDGNMVDTVFTLFFFFLG